MQSTHGLQAIVVQQLCLHCAGVPPMRTTQAWKHEISLAHCALFTQFSVCGQHAPMMHWLHGVPPGSSVHGPESGGATPQWPPVQVRPTQHCAGSLQLEPGGRQLPSPQMPLLQALLQHSALLPHMKPSSLHWFAPQRPTLHTPLQHCPPVLQPKPSGVHIPKPHAPVLGSQKPAQHIELSLHGAPSGEQLLKPQAPVFGLQNVEQQSVLLKQPTPSGMHIPKPHWLDLGLQKPVQHSLSCLQNWLSGEQPLPQVFVARLQSLAQHSWLLVHVCPSGKQAAQKPSSTWQTPPQHCVESEQPLPVWTQPQVLLDGSHTPPQHSEPCPQLLPLPLQGTPPQIPPWQTELQQSPALVQEVPLFWHFWKSHLPFWQMLLQHSNPLPQEVPLGEHTTVPQTPFVQAPVQHCPAEEHTNPSGWQELPQKPLTQFWSQQSLAAKHWEPCGRH